MKRLGALYVQSCTCLLPGLPGIRLRLKEIAQRIEAMSGCCLTFDIRSIEEPELSEVIAGFRDQSDREYDEIIVECTTRCQKEIEFERFRQHFTYEEAEEIFADLEKIRVWLGRAIERDWFGSERRAEAECQVAFSEQALEAFERECFAAGGDQGEMDRRNRDQALPGTTAVRPLGLGRRRTARRTGVRLARRAAEEQ